MSVGYWRSLTRRLRYSLAGAAAVVALFGFGVMASAGHGVDDFATTTSISPLGDFDTGAPTGGESYLTRTSTQLLSVLDTQGLDPRAAYTTWWVVFNNPGACSGACGEDDIFLLDGTLNAPGVAAAEIGVINASGSLVFDDDGHATIGAVLGLEDNGTHQVLFGAGLASEHVLTNIDAEVHIIVREHGQSRGGKALNGQLTDVDGGCTPACEDVQAAVHHEIP